MPDEQGVYWDVQGRLQRLPVETITLRGPRGFETDTGAIQRQRSNFVLTSPFTFIVRTPDNVVADEYLLVQLFIRDDRREFRTLMGGLWRGDGIEHMSVPFESERLATNVYRVRVGALPKGEFGFLRPGAQLPIAAAIARPDNPSGVSTNRFEQPKSGSDVLTPQAAGVSGAPGSVSPARPASDGLGASAGAIFTFGVR
jgi:hypothetical protein